MNTDYENLKIELSNLTRCIRDRKEITEVLEKRKQSIEKLFEKHGE